MCTLNRNVKGSRCKSLNTSVESPIAEFGLLTWKWKCRCQHLGTPQLQHPLSCQRMQAEGWRTPRWEQPCNQALHLPGPCQIHIEPSELQIYVPVCMLHFNQRCKKSAVHLEEALVCTHALPCTNRWRGCEHSYPNRCFARALPSMRATGVKGILLVTSPMPQMEGTLTLLLNSSTCMLTMTLPALLQLGSF